MNEGEWLTRKRRLDTKLTALNPPWLIIPWRAGLDTFKLTCHAVMESGATPNWDAAGSEEFEMSGAHRQSSPAGRKRIAHRFIGGLPDVLASRVPQDGVVECSLSPLAGLVGIGRVITQR